MVKGIYCRCCFVCLFVCLFGWLFFVCLVDWLVDWLVGSGFLRVHNVIVVVFVFDILFSNYYLFYIYIYSFCWFFVFYIKNIWGEGA